MGAVLDGSVQLSLKYITSLDRVHRSYDPLTEIKHLSSTCTDDRKGLEFAANLCDSSLRSLSLEYNSSVCQVPEFLGLPM